MVSKGWSSDNFLAGFSEQIDSIDFFESIKPLCEKEWEKISLISNVWGYQIQPGSKWKPGLSESDIQKFEETLGFTFPPSLKNFYSVMNGLSKPGINIGGDAGTPPEYQSQFYSLPQDIELVQEYISWIYKENHVTIPMIQKEGISRIFPIYGHRFMLIDHPGNPILSMYGDDIIYWSDSIGELLAIDILNYSNLSIQKRVTNIDEKTIKFWLRC